MTPFRKRSLFSPPRVVVPSTRRYFNLPDGTKILKANEKRPGRLIASCQRVFVSSRSFSWVSSTIASTVGGRRRGGVSNKLYISSDHSDSCGFSKFQVKLPKWPIFSASLSCTVITSSSCESDSTRRATRSRIEYKRYTESAVAGIASATKMPMMPEGKISCTFSPKVVNTRNMLSTTTC
ncbi:MAG: hypothetical protein JW384_01432 [Nitrosomonadaceae bacterium]|nr:hypothetical protein [Nitrosomonadaceae bacterium]